ncbi:hypothetical protein JCM19538_497 [Jejuia pallidilutea]|uniref:Uncharacterized protein n=1 Tax=Jejuia pallidilutea TaxID=504487 RepID=A0A098LWG4_9FLAO|nr:hypothetical protein JCM19538_497 [Jejuia pallidilutea]
MNTGIFVQWNLNEWLIVLNNYSSYNIKTYKLFYIINACPYPSSIVSKVYKKR